jgi:hypothetical protein
LREVGVIEDRHVVLDVVWITSQLLQLQVNLIC